MRRYVSAPVRQCVDFTDVLSYRVTAPPTHRFTDAPSHLLGLIRTIQFCEQVAEMQLEAGQYVGAV